MRISHNFSVALQILMLSKHYSDQKITSNFLSHKIGTDPVIIRNVMSALKEKKYIDSKPGPSGLTLLADLNEIPLYNLYTAVTEEDGNILKFYTPGKDSTDFENKLIKTTNDCFNDYISSYYNELKAHTVGDIYDKCISGS